jgi:hypothetical protein
MNPTMIQFFHWYSEGDGNCGKKPKNRPDI